MRHRYTWQPRVDDVTADPATDDWGNPILTTDPASAGAPVTDKPCLFTDTATVSLGSAGPIQVEVNRLVVPFDDPIRVGDYVAAVSDPATGNALIQEPARVESMNEIAPHGAVIYRVARLRYAEVQ